MFNALWCPVVKVDATSPHPLSRYLTPPRIWYWRAELIGHFHISLQLTNSCSARKNRILWGIYPHLKHLLGLLLSDTDTSNILVDNLHHIVMEARCYCWCYPPRMIYPIFKGRLHSVYLAVKAYRLICLHRLSRL